MLGNTVSRCASAYSIADPPSRNATPYNKGTHASQISDCSRKPALSQRKGFALKTQLRPASAQTTAVDVQALPSNPPAPPAKKKRELWKILPGLAISAFFLWQILKSIHYNDLRSVHMVHPQWIAVLLAFLVGSYTLRIYRWWFMLRRSGAPSFAVCSRVLLTSFAANNVLPFRIGDFLRIFSYSGDLRASSSTILSTVILERLLDIFALLTFLVALLIGAARSLPPFVMHGHALNLLHFAEPILLLCALGLTLLLFGASLLQAIVLRIVAKLGDGPRTDKLKRWALLLFDAVLKMSFAGRVFLLASTVVIWLCEGMIFVSAARLLDIPSGHRGPWLALALSNLSFLLPSSPGAIGTYEFASQFAMVSQGAQPTISALYGLLVHIIVFVSVTAAGGIAFLAHRIHRGAASKPLAEDLAELPSELPADLPAGPA